MQFRRIYLSVKYILNSQPLLDSQLWRRSNFNLCSGLEKILTATRKHFNFNPRRCFRTGEDFCHNPASATISNFSDDLQLWLRSPASAKKLQLWWRSPNLVMISNFGESKQTRPEKNFSDDPTSATTIHFKIQSPGQLLHAASEELSSWRSASDNLNCIFLRSSG